MPTARSRHMVTETDEVAAALDDAAKRWPAERGNRARLLLRLVEEGHRAVVGAHERDVRGRQRAVERTSGVLSALYGARYLDDLREDWPQ